MLSARGVVCKKSKATFNLDQISITCFLNKPRASDFPTNKQLYPDLRTLLYCCCKRLCNITEDFLCKRSKAKLVSLRANNSINSLPYNNKNEGAAVDFSSLVLFHALCHFMPVFSLSQRVLLL